MSEPQFTAHDVRDDLRKEIQRVTAERDGAAIEASHFEHQYQEERKRREAAEDFIIRRAARRFASRDPEQRDTAFFAQLLRDECTWADGRPVISAALAAKLPCPYPEIKDE